MSVTVRWTRDIRLSLMNIPHIVDASFSCELSPYQSVSWITPECALFHPIQMTGPGSLRFVWCEETSITSYPNNVLRSYQPHPQQLQMHCATMMCALSHDHDLSHALITCMRPTLMGCQLDSLKRSTNTKLSLHPPHQIKPAMCNQACRYTSEALC